MRKYAGMVSIHPYFKVRPGRMEEFRTALAGLIEKTSAEDKNLFYDFTVNGDLVFCREGYADAEGLLSHVQGVAPLLKPMLEMSDLTRVEVHGPAAELETLRGPLAGLNPVWFVRLCGVER